MINKAFKKLWRQVLDNAMYSHVDSNTIFTDEEYQTQFVFNKKDEELKMIFEKVWDAKTREIDRYLTRSNYCWALQVASFAGYFSVISSKGYEANPQILFIVISIGIVTSTAWISINVGSKYWQNHWDKHLQFLGDKVVGPLAISLLVNKPTSIGNVNDIISRFIRFLWCILAVKYFHEHITVYYTVPENIDYVVWLTTLCIFYFIWVIKFGYGTGKK